MAVTPVFASSTPTTGTVYSVILVQGRRRSYPSHGSTASGWRTSSQHYLSVSVERCTPRSSSTRRPAGRDNSRWITSRGSGHTKAPVSASTATSNGRSSSTTSQRSEPPEVPRTRQYRFGPQTLGRVDGRPGQRARNIERPADRSPNPQRVCALSRSNSRNSGHSGVFLFTPVMSDIVAF